MMMILSTPEQRKKIGFLRKLTGLDEEVYREILFGFNGAKSSKDLTAFNAQDLIEYLEKKAREMGVYKAKKYENLGYRRGMATPKQLRYINALWKDVSFQTTEENKEKAFNAFIYRITGVQRVNFLTSRDVSKIVKAIKTMQKGGLNG